MAEPPKLKAALFGETAAAAFVGARLWIHAWWMNILCYHIMTVNVETSLPFVNKDWQWVRLRHLSLIHI